MRPPIPLQGEGNPGPAGQIRGHAAPRRRAKISPGDNRLTGYGLVVGSDGTDDKLNDNMFARESLVGRPDRQGRPIGRFAPSVAT
jgi:hypothetical protein